jgi:very-short-patch-repair endonuclease
MHDQAWLDEAIPLIIAETPRVVTRTDALRHFGADAIDYRCRVGRWQRMAPAIYLTDPPATPLDRLRAAALHGGAGCAISGAAALAAWNFRSVSAPSRELVLVPVTSYVKSWGRTQVRRTTRSPVRCWRRGVPLASVARAVADHVVTLRRLDQVQSVVAEAVQRRLCVVADLAVELEAGPRRGSRLFREALRDVGYGAHSVPEARAGRLLRQAGISGFSQNVEIRVGNRWFVADFLWSEVRAVLEIDSTEHHLSPEDHAATLEHDQVLQAAGYAVLHVKPSQLRDPDTFTALVQAWLAAVARRTAS